MSITATINAPSGPIRVGAGERLTIIGGPCALESEKVAIEVGETMRECCATLGLPYIFKASFDKANRSSLGSKRGPGLEEGLEILGKIRETVGVAITSDIHTAEQAEPAAEVLDILQIPAFLCRQTDLLIASGEAAALHKRCVNIKKGQFLSPSEMAGPIEKVRSTGCQDVIVTERGTFFGYHRLVTDLIGLGDLMELDVPTCFDCTHSAQLPGASASAENRVTGGRRDRIPMLANAAAAAGVQAIFMEVHPDPDRALSDASTQIPLAEAPAILKRIAAIYEAAGHR
ncbi:MAG: 3-deoxy-8-phosphooctulonate synthase [Planctomycetota bacterium]